MLFILQLRKLASKRDAPLPLYLSLACEELRVFGSFEGFKEQLQTLPATLDTLVLSRLARLEAAFEPALIKLSLLLLLDSRAGAPTSSLCDLTNSRTVPRDDSDLNTYLITCV